MSSTTATVHASKVSSADWDRTAKSYAQTAAKGPMAVPTQCLIELFDTVEPLSLASAILDVGCGPGGASAQLIKTFSSIIPSTAQFLATDFSSGMVRQVAQTRESKLADLPAGQERDIWSRVTPLIMDAMDMRPLLDESMSHIIANHVFFMTEDPFKCVAESYRVLRSGGVLACSSWHKVSWIDYLEIAAERTFTPLRQAIPEKFKMPAEWLTGEGVKAQLANAGFRDVRVEYVDTAIIPENLEVWTRMFVASGNPAVAWVTDVLGDAGQQDFGNHFMQVVKENCRVDENGSCVITGTAIVAVGRK